MSQKHKPRLDNKLPFKNYILSQPVKFYDFHSSSIIDLSVVHFKQFYNASKLHYYQCFKAFSSLDICYIHIKFTINP